MILSRKKWQNERRRGERRGEGKQIKIFIFKNKWMLIFKGFWLEIRHFNLVAASFCWLSDVANSTIKFYFGALPNFPRRLNCFSDLSIHLRSPFELFWLLSNRKNTKFPIKLLVVAPFTLKSHLLKVVFFFCHKILLSFLYLKFRKT